MPAEAQFGKRQSTMCWNVLGLMDEVAIFNITKLFGDWRGIQFLHGNQ